MKRLIMLAALALLATASARAQSAAGLGEANIPYHFTVGERHLPPGQYSFERLSPSSDFVVVRGADARVRVVAAATAAPAGRQGERSRLVLRRNGRGYFLAQIWTAGEPYRLDLRPPRATRGEAAQAAPRDGELRHREIALAGRRR